MERVFFALWPDEEVRAALYALAESWRQTCGGRVTRRENLHATVVFIGSVDASRLALLKDMTTAVSCEPFVMEIDRGGYFKHNRIAWAGTSRTPGALSRVVTTLRQTLIAAGFDCDDRDYVAHVTLQRDAVRAPPKFIDCQIEWHIDAVTLVTSRNRESGVTYEVVARSARA
jgi:2'-5' RNA ligase